MLKRTVNIKVWQVYLLVFAFLAVLLGACTEQTTASNNNASTAANKWGATPNITNYYEYLQLKQIYEARDNPKIVLNAYLYSEVTGQLSCLGKVAGYGVPYGTQWSQSIGADNQGSIPEPNGLYPSQNTNADWIRIIDAQGKQHLTFAEPNLVITDMNLPCKQLTN